MTPIKYFAVALVLTACAENIPGNAATTAPAAPTTAALVTLENHAFAAWQSKDAKFWHTFLSDRFVGYGSSGKLDKASATKEYTAANCTINSYALSDVQMKPIRNNAALLTYKGTVDGTCDGQTFPADSWEASVYVREGDRWKNIFHAEDPIVDPTAASPKPADEKQASKRDEAHPSAPDAGTSAMLAVEKTVWEAWKNHDAKAIEKLTGTDISFINIFGTYLATKADALENWSGTGCEVKSVNLTDAVGTMLSPTTGILTFSATADGTCYGQKVGPIWGTSIYVEDGNTWKWTFGINVSARP